MVFPLHYPDYICAEHPKKPSTMRKNKLSHPCIVGGVHYESEKKASETLGIDASTVRRRLQSSNFPEYVSKHRQKKVRKAPSHPCVIDGVHYESEKRASETLGIYTNTLRRRLQSLNFPEYVSKHLPKKDRRTRSHPCTVDGVHYESEKDAAEDLGIYTRTLRRRLQSSNFPEYVSKHLPKKDSRTFVSCCVAGIEYKSIGDAARETGIHYKEMVSRLTSPDYPDYVCEKRPKAFSKCRYTVDGKKYRTLQEVASIEGLSQERIRQKINDPSYTKYQRL